MGRLVKIDNRTDNNINSNEKKGRLVRVSDTPELELGYMIRDAKKRETPVPQPSRTTNNTARQQPRANSFVQGSGMSKLQQMEAQREERQQKTQNPARAAKAAQIVREAEARSPRARSVQKADTGTLNDRGSVQRARNGYELGEKRSRDTRVGKAAQSIALNTIGSTEMLGEGLKQANENVDILAGDQIYSQLQGQYEQMGRQLNGAVQRYGMDSQEAESIRQSMNEVRERLTARRGQIEKTIDTGSHAYRTAQMGQEAASQALEGLSGVGGFLGETALSIADNASLLPLAAINPALPLVIMSIKAAGSRAKELTDQGTTAGEALSRGVVSGIIEGLSENVSLGSFLEMVNTGGRGWLLNLLKQAGVEGAEEITSYIANYAMDKAAQDPNAQFDAGEMLRQGASGALSGLVFGGAGTAVNRVNGYSGVDYSQVDSIQGDGAPSAIERSVQNVRKTLGAEGQSTFDQMRTEGQDPSAAVDYTERFVDAYNKGKRNEAIPKAAEMTDAEAETRAAWNAGRVDALTREGARNKQNQATREAGAGIIRTEYTDSLDQKTVSALDRAAKQLGVTVEFADEVEGGKANAEIQGRRITISKVTDNPVRAVFGHEITHRIQELSADSYAEYKAAVQEVMGDRWTLELEATKALADQYGISYSEDQLADEVVADYAGELLQNDGTLERFIQSAQSKPTLLKRIAQVFRDLVNKLRGTEKAQAERALGKLEKAYRAAAKAEKSGGEIVSKYSLKRPGENVKAATRQESLSMNATAPENVARYQSEITEVLDGTMHSNQMVLLGKPSAVLAQYMGSDNPLYMPQKSVKKAVFPKGENGGKHGLGRVILDELLYQLEDPLAITGNTSDHAAAGDHSIVVWTDWKTEAGDSVIVPIRIDATGTVGIYNNVNTVFDAFDPEYVADLMREGNVLYTKNGKSLSELIDQRREVPKIENGNALSGTSVTETGENVKRNLSLKGQGANDALVEKLTRQVRDGKITMEQALEQVRQDAADRTTAAELRSRKQLEQENDRLRERVSALKAQMKPTEQKTVRKADTDRVSREILKAYDSEADAESIRDQVKALGDYLVESGGGDEGVSWEGLMARALPLGREIVENARVLNDDMAKKYADLRSYLRETKLVISEQDSHDITDYNATRKALMGTVSLRRGENGNVESVYADMAARWPEFFNMETITHPAEMVEHIREVMDAIKPSYENPHSANLDYAAEMAAQDVIERILGPDVRQSPETYADRQAKALEAQKARYQALLRKEKAKRADAVAELKAKARAKDAARSESRNARDIRGKIERHTKALSKKLLNPTDKSHIPQRLRGPVAKALESINLQGKKEGSKRAEAFTQLKKAYQAIAQDDAGGFIVDPDLLGDQAEGFTGLFDRLIETADTPIHQMSASQLADVWKVVRGLEHAVETAGKTLASEKYAKTQDWVTAFSIDTLTRRPKRNGVMQRFIQDEMDPYTFFHQYGDSGMEVYRMLRNAQDTQTRRISALGEQVQRIIGDADMKKIQTTRHTFTTEEGKTLTLTDGQIMDLYNLARREQAQEHLMTGGIVQPEIKRSGKQKHIEQGNDSVRLTANDIQEIIGVLTPEERTIADGLQKLTTSTLSGWGNEASMGAYGYEKFTQGDYWPIRSAKNALHSNVEKGGNNTRSIKNIGMAKATIPGANNAVEIGDVFDTFSRHAADMIDYSVWLLPMEDAGRLYNYRFRDEKGPTGQTIKGMLDKIGGKGSQQYWARLMEDIQNGINASADTSTERLIQKVVGNTKGARVGANVRVVLQQPTAFLRANAVLSPGSLTKGLAKGVTPGSGWEKAQKWAGIAKIKDVGGFDQGNARSVSQQIYNTQTAMDKLNNVTSWGAEKADALTWGRLWNASEHETKRLHPELEAGADAFYRKTAEIFTDMIDQSQVVDGILQRSQIMRSGNAFNKMATAFMGEPTKTLNMFIRAWDDFRYETDGKKRAAARGKFARTAAALVATDVVNALFQALWDAVRDDDKDKNYRQRLWRAWTGLDGDEVTPGDYAKALASGNIADNMNPLGRLPYVKDVLSIWQGYTVERADMDAIADAIKAAQSLNDAIQGKGKRTAWYAAEQLIGTTAVMFGVPVKTLTRDVRGLIRSIAQSTGSWEVVYEAEKFTYKPAANKKQFMDLLWTVKQKDESAYEAIRKDMEEHGYFAEDPKDAYHVAEASPAEQTRAYIDEQMEKRDRENSKGAGKISYEGLMDSVTQTSAYQQASAASKNKAADKASALAKGTSAGRSLAGKLEKYKIDPEEYLEYLLWMDKYDEPSKNGKYGSYTNEERKKAIDATNASRSTKAGLWILAGGSEKSNPYD